MWFGAGMVKWELVYTKQAQKDAKKLTSTDLQTNAIQIINILDKNLFKIPPSFEKLIGDLSGAYSRRINIQHRIVYQVLEDKKIIKIIRMYTHDELIKWSIVKNKREKKMAKDE
jgi:toxin YoeB